jgi:hypothetical protein
VLKIEIDAGEGNLNARAYVAAVVGPYRLAHGSQRSLVLAADVPQKIAANPGVNGSDQAMFVGVALQPGQLPVSVLFGASSSMGGASSVPANMDTTIGAAGGVSFSQVLLPGEELWVVSPTATALVALTVGF